MRGKRLPRDRQALLNAGAIITSKHASYLANVVARNTI